MSRPDSSLAVPGFRAAGIHCGIKARSRDLALVVSDVPATVGGVFTTSTVVGAPVEWSRTRVAKGTARALVINSGISNVAMGLATRLRNGVADPDGMRQAAEEISAQALRAGKIIRRLRTFVRKEDTRSEACDLNRAVREAAHLVEPDARGPEIAVRVVLDPNLPPVEVDRVQIQQVLVNLYRNAVEAMADGSKENRELLIQTLA